MNKIKIDLNSQQNILNMLMDSSLISTEQMTKINTTSKEIGKTKLETAIELNFIDEEKIEAFHSFKEIGNKSETNTTRT